MLLSIAHPAVANRSCEDCLKYIYNHETGKRQLDPKGNPIPRPAGGKAPCQATVGAPREVRERICAKIAPDAGVELNEKNRAAHEHYQECKAVGVFPDDSIVRRNARIIRQIEDMHAASKLECSLVKMMGAR